MSPRFLKPLQINLHPHRDGGPGEQQQQKKKNRNFCAISLVCVLGSLISSGGNARTTRHHVPGHMRYVVLQTQS